MEETDGQEGVSWHWAVLTWGWGVIGRQKLFLPFSVHLGASLVAQMVKTLSAMQETWVLSLSGRSPGEGNGNPLQYSCLEKSLDSRSLVGYSPWWQSWTGLSDFHFLFNASLLLLLLFFSWTVCWNFPTGFLDFIQRYSYLWIIVKIDDMSGDDSIKHLFCHTAD